MKSACLLSLVPLLFASCGTVHEWNELRSAPMSLAECYDGLVYIATAGGLAPDVANCDRGLGTWQSRWRTRQLRPFGIGRYRLKAEVLLEEGTAERGWPVRYLVERQKIGDPRHEHNPTEDDWEDDGQDREEEALFGDRLARRLGIVL